MRAMAYVENIFIYLIIATSMYFGITDNLNYWGWSFVLLLCINSNKSEK